MFSKYCVIKINNVLKCSVTVFVLAGCLPANFNVASLKDTIGSFKEARDSVRDLKTDPLNVCPIDISVLDEKKLYRVSQNKKTEYPLVKLSAVNCETMVNGKLTLKPVLNYDVGSWKTKLFGGTFSLKNNVSITCACSKTMDVPTTESGYYARQTLVVDLSAIQKIKESGAVGGDGNDKVRNGEIKPNTPVVMDLRDTFKGNPVRCWFTDSEDYSKYKK